MVKAYIVEGLGIGCDREAAHAFERAGAKTEMVHIKQLLSGEKSIAEGKILDLPGGFLHGDLLGAGMCAANELEHAIARDGGRRIKEQWLEFVEDGGIIYGQCNGFQLLVKTGLLPGIGNTHHQQTATLTGNDCGVYRVSPVLHRVEKPHFAFEGIETVLLWCRHGEGKVEFWTPHGLQTQHAGEETRTMVNRDHVLLRYVHPATGEPTQEFPHNPNGSVDAIAGLANGRIFGHMAHTEVSVYASRDPRWFWQKEQLRRQGTLPSTLTAAQLEGEGLRIFRNIVGYFR